MNAASLIRCPACGLDVAAGTPACPIDGTALDSEVERDARPDLLIDAQVGEYVVKGAVGEGGMGVVYEGLQPVIGKRVAIKVLRREIANDPHEAARLLTEARTVNSIGHRGIIDIFSLGRLADGRQYLVMEFLVGVSLHDHVQAFAPLQIFESLQILDEILAALSAAHGAGVIHRDLKPNNVFLVSQPDGSRYVKVLDFGLAKQSPFKHGESPQTRVSRVLGTPEFMAPEQARGQPVGPRTDLYALGCVAFEMFTARLPFDGPSGWEIVNQHLNTPAPQPSAFVAAIPDEIDALVLWLLAKDPAERPPSAEAVRQEIKKIRKVLEVSATLQHPLHRPGPSEDGPQTLPPLEAGKATVAGRDQSSRPTATIDPPRALAATRIEGGRSAATVGGSARQDKATMVAPRQAAATVIMIPARETAVQTAEAPAYVPERPRLVPPPSPPRTARAGIALGGGLVALLGLGFWAISGRAPTAPAAAPIVAGPENNPVVLAPAVPAVAPLAARPEDNPVVRPSPVPVAPTADPLVARPEDNPVVRPPSVPVAAPKPDVKRQPSLSSARAALLARIDELRQAPARLGAQRSPVALVLLDDARAQAIAARTVKELREVDEYLVEWERKFSAQK